MITRLKENVRLLIEKKEKIQKALKNVENAKNGITSLNAAVSFNYIASESNMSSYWNVPGSTSQTYIINNLNELANDFKDGGTILSASSEITSKANEKIAEIEREITNLQNQIAALEAEELKNEVNE